MGDRAQARHGFTESWQERLDPVGLRDVDLVGLSINYRTWAEVMAVAEPVIRSALPDANVPTSIRESGVPVRHGKSDERDGIIERWLADDADGTACVIGDDTFDATSRVRSLPPEQVKGLEFDLVVLVEPDLFGEGIEGAVDRYVAMTRATQQLVILRRPVSSAVPSSLHEAGGLLQRVALAACREDEGGGVVAHSPVGGVEMRRLDEGAAASVRGDHSVGLERAVGLGDRVGSQSEVRCQLSHGGEPDAGRELAARDHGGDPAAQLLERRDVGVVEGEGSDEVHAPILPEADRAGRRASLQR